MIPLMPKKFCNQSIGIRLLTGRTDRYNKQEFEAEIRINHVIFKPQTIYSGSNNNREVVANAIAFLFASVSRPFPNLDKRHVGSKLIFENKEYSIQKIIDNRNPFTNEIYTYELEVL